jgi:hypothetical protein
MTNYFPNGYTNYNSIAWGSESLDKLFSLLPDARLCVHPCTHKHKGTA